MTPAGRSWLQPATTLMALTGILLAGAAAGSAPVDPSRPPGHRDRGAAGDRRDLRQFPFDRQNLWIRVAALGDAGPVAFQPDPQRTGRMPRVRSACPGPLFR